MPLGGRTISPELFRLGDDHGAASILDPAAFPDTYPGLGAEITFIERFGLYPTIDIYEGQELAGGRTIGSTLKALGIGPHTLTRSSAIPLIGQKGSRPPLEPLSEGRSG
jgi:hypothetical protein